MSSIGYREQSDKRQYGGMLMLLGFCAVIQPCANIVSAFGPDGANTTDPDDIPFWGMVGAFVLFVNGVVAVLVGYMSNTLDISHHNVTAFLIVLNQAAWIPYLTDMSNVWTHAQDDPEENVFIPLAYEPTENDVKFVGAMGFVGILTYGFAFVGSISFVAFSLHAYNIGKALERDGAYFKGRLGFYSGVLALGGLAQMTLGAYCRVNFADEEGVLGEGPVRAAMFTVTYPTTSILVGLFQVLMGTWGTVRSVGYHQGRNDFYFQIFLAVQWLLVLCSQCLTQIAYLPGGDLAAAAPTVVAMSLGINAMPAFLDQKMRTLPLHLASDYYALPSRKYRYCDDSEYGASVTKGSAVSFDGHEHHEHHVAMAEETNYTNHYLEPDPTPIDEIDV